MFLALPLLPGLVRWSNAHLGRWVALLPATAGGAAAAVVLTARLARSRRGFPRPHLGLLLLDPGDVGRGGGGSFSSPVGAVHLPEYGLLAVLASRALGALSPAPVAGGWRPRESAFLDETVQGFVPNRVFDWWTSP